MQRIEVQWGIKGKWRSSFIQASSAILPLIYWYYLTSCDLKVSGETSKKLHTSIQGQILVLLLLFKQEDAWSIYWLSMEVPFRPRLKGSTCLYRGKIQSWCSYLDRDCLRMWWSFECDDVLLKPNVKIVYAHTGAKFWSIELNLLPAIDLSGGCELNLLPPRILGHLILFETTLLTAVEFACFYWFSYWHF